jgi:GNAT superfamily N-acetyltransferase
LSLSRGAGVVRVRDPETAVGKMDGLKLRRARSDDSEFAYRVKRAAFKEYIEQVWEWDEDVQRRIHERRFVGEGFRIISVGGVDAGFVSMDTAADCVKVNQLFILPEHQSKGVGRVCMLLVMQEARELGLPVRLRVMKVNPRARAFYERLGFARYGEAEAHDLMEWRPDG